MRGPHLPAFVGYLMLALPGVAAPPVATLAPATEPGVRLIVSGRVFDAAGKRPVPGVTIYAYHTDRTGHYSAAGHTEPRLRGWVTTDQEGTFELRTIRPAPYPRRREPAHIHLELSGASYPRQWARDIQFADDPYVTAEMRRHSAAQGRFAWILSPVRGRDGVLRANINIRLKPKGN